MKNPKVKYGVLAAILVAAIIIGVVINNATSKSGSTAKSMSSSSSMLSQAVATRSVTISNYAYSPMVIKVPVGATVTWTNKDAVHHSVTAVTASAFAPNSPLFGQNQTYSFTFKKAGTYPVYCQLHPYMHATIIVQG